MFRADVEVFQIEAIATQPGGVAEKVHRKADGLIASQTDQRMSGCALGKQCALDVFDGGGHFVSCPFVVSQFRDEGQYLCRIAVPGWANLKFHDDVYPS